jgi:hypothetical protein
MPFSTPVKFEPSPIFIELYEVDYVGDISNRAEFGGHPSSGAIVKLI